MSKNPWVQALEGEMPLHLAIALQDPQTARQAWNRLGHKQIVPVIAAVPALALEAAVRIVEMVIAALGWPDVGPWDGVQPAPPFIHEALRLLRADLIGDRIAHTHGVELCIAAETQIGMGPFRTPFPGEREWSAVDNALFILEVARGEHIEETPALQALVAALDRRLAEMINAVTKDESAGGRFAGHPPPMLTLASMMTMLHALPLPSVEEIFAAASSTR